MARALFGEKRSLVDPAGPSAEPLGGLRLAIELQPSRRGNIVLFTGPQSGAGTSTVAANYALVAARTQGRVLLIDADLRNPRLHDIFEVPRAPGLVEVLRDRLDPAGATQRLPTPGNLSLLTAGSGLEWHGDLAASRQMGDILQRASEEYDLVVLDSPPVLTASDVAGLASHQGIDVVVVVPRRSRKRPLVQTLRRLKLTEAHVLGLVLNREGDLASQSP